MITSVHVQTSQTFGARSTRVSPPRGRHDGYECAPTWMKLSCERERSTQAHWGDVLVWSFYRISWGQVRDLGDHLHDAYISTISTVRVIHSLRSVLVVEYGSQRIHSLWKPDATSAAALPSGACIMNELVDLCSLTAPVRSNESSSVVNWVSADL